MSEQRNWKDDPRLVAYSLEEWSELSAADVEEIEGALKSDPACREALEGIRAVNDRVSRVLVGAASGQAPADGLASDVRAEIALAARRGARSGRRWSPSLVGGFAAAAAAFVTAVGLGVFDRPGDGPGARNETDLAGVDEDTSRSEDRFGRELAGGLPVPEVEAPSVVQAPGDSAKGGEDLGRTRGRGESPRAARKSVPPGADGESGFRGQPQRRPNVELSVAEKAPAESPKLGVLYSRSIDGPAEGIALKQQTEGMAAKRRVVDTRHQQEDTRRVAVDLDEPRATAGLQEEAESLMAVTERVAPAETPFTSADADPFSTFSIDVDTASYSSARAAIQAGRVPDPDAIRVEEFVNYFTYGDTAPKAGDERPFAVTVQAGAAPWEPRHRLVRIGMKARSMDFAQRRRANLVFLVDVSGSMRRANKLPLVKRALGILTESLHPEDRVAIAVYASAQGLALDSTPVAAREAILQSLERLEGGGSTNAGAGIQLAYAVAREHFIEGGVNRVILCTDGDFNVGVTDPDALEELIAAQAATGVELTVLGFGGSTRGDERMETLSNRGNGNYALIDSELEARKVLAEQVGGTLLTVASDVKIQVAWNAARVAAFRLVGYENRMLEHQDFLDDTKDAGEIGAGHGVTALYEVVPRGVDVQGGLVKTIEAMEHTPEGSIPEAYVGDGLVEVRLRYKQPGATASVGFGVVGRDGGASFDGAPSDLRFAAAVATFAQILRGAPEVKGVSAENVREWALMAKGDDPGGLREAFVQLLERYIDARKELGGR